jgi:hypothetical protein
LLLVLFSFSFAIVNSFLYMKDVALRCFDLAQKPQAQGPLTIRPKFLRSFSAAKRSSRKKVSHFPSPKGQKGFLSHPPLSKPILSLPQTPPSPAPDTLVPS